MPNNNSGLNSTNQQQGNLNVNESLNFPKPQNNDSNQFSTFNQNQNFDISHHSLNNTFPSQSGNNDFNNPYNNINSSNSNVNPSQFGQSHDLNNNQNLNINASVSDNTFPTFNSKTNTTDNHGPGDFGFPEAKHDFK
jgi:hypothetical protein